MKIKLQLGNATSTDLKELESWLRSEPALNRVDLRREHAPAQPGDMGVLMDCLQLVLEDALLPPLGQAIFDYWLSRGVFAPAPSGPEGRESEAPALRIEWTDSADGSRSVTVEARDQETAASVLRELPRALRDS
ncbi:effector-associated constant component EACC1 [Streptomyces scabiei]|uniref:effector-associated constant component EACC1 n=1 Tax=Streptomyces scabiei TaxID=1930 RepID=UPI0038F7292C